MGYRNLSTLKGSVLIIPFPQYLCIIFIPFEWQYYVQIFLKYAGNNIIHEHVVMLHMFSTSFICITHAQSFSLDCIHNFLYIVILMHDLYLAKPDLVKHVHCLQLTGSSSRRCVGKFLHVCLKIMFHFTSLCNILYILGNLLVTSLPGSVLVAANAAVIRDTFRPGSQQSREIT